MRVCFISHSAGKYGAELALLELLQGLSKSGVHCLVLVPKKGPLLTELDRLNIEWRVIRYPPWISRKKQLPYRILRTFKGLAAVVRMAMAFSQWRCDLVYTNTIAVSAGAFAARLLRKPHIWHSHESGYRNPRVKFDLGNRWAARLIDRLSMIIIVVSHSIADDYSPFIKPERMRLIYQSVTPHDEVEEAIDSPSNKKSFKCVIVGSLDPWKGQDEAIKALSELIRRGIDA
ncbi:MAG TPA: glycosyltransferase, partial [Candidatus Saccharimonadales bacterium]|nr:glycosyltransferase [Candidatus Saccharimonadales bacterium]